MTENGFYVIYAPEFIRLAYSWEPSERNYEGAKLIAQAIKNAR
jgi:DNA-binding transcriptional MocR family regulator